MLCDFIPAEIEETKWRCRHKPKMERQCEWPWSKHLEKDKNRWLETRACQHNKSWRHTALNREKERLMQLLREVLYVFLFWQEYAASHVAELHLCHVGLLLHLLLYCWVSLLPFSPSLIIKEQIFLHVLCLLSYFSKIGEEQLPEDAEDGPPELLVGLVQNAVTNLLIVHVL